MSREDLKEAIKDTIIKHKKIVFGVDSPICIKCLDKLRKQQVINAKVYTKKFTGNSIMKLH